MKMRKDDIMEGKKYSYEYEVYVSQRKIYTINDLKKSLGTYYSVTSAPTKKLIVEFHKDGLAYDINKRGKFISLCFMDKKDFLESDFDGFIKLNNLNYETVYNFIHHITRDTELEKLSIVEGDNFLYSALFNGKMIISTSPVITPEIKTNVALYLNNRYSIEEEVDSILDYYEFLFDTRNVFSNKTKLDKVYYLNFIRGSVDISTDSSSSMYAIKDFETLIITLKAIISMQEKDDPLTFNGFENFVISNKIIEVEKEDKPIIFISR